MVGRGFDRVVREQADVRCMSVLLLVRARASREVVSVWQSLEPVWKGSLDAVERSDSDRSVLLREGDVSIVVFALSCVVLEACLLYVERRYYQSLMGVSNWVFDGPIAVFWMLLSTLLLRELPIVVGVCFLGRCASFPW